MLANLKRNYKKLKIRNKLMVILFTIIFASGALSAIFIQLAFGIYDEILYSQSAEVLNLYSNNIENELKRAERLTNNIVLDSKIQELAYTMAKHELSFERYRASNALNEILLSYSFRENYVASISFIDKVGSDLTFGRDSRRLNILRKNEAMIKAAENSGGNTWIDPDETDKYVVSAREIRYVKDGSLEILGYLIVRVDIDRLTKLSSNVSSKYQSGLMILSGDNKIHSSKEAKNVGDLIQGEVYDRFVYFIKNLNNQRYFITYTTSTYTNWTYINVLPYNTVFKEISGTRGVLAVIYGLIFVCAAMLRLKFSKSITNPVVKLRERMKKVEKGDFELEGDCHEAQGEDEVEHLEYDFAVMVNKINNLITENYQKQIVISETELKALQAQINPHFLYNTLDTINWLAKVNKTKEVSEVVESLGNLFRASISSKRDVVTLEEELSILEDYLKIQKFRYDDRLKVIIDVEDQAYQSMVPRLTLQPIVENSINYALENMLEPCLITIRSQRSKSGYEVSIEDNGPGMEPTYLLKLQKGEIKPKGTGIGLKNIDERLKLIFGKEYGIVINSELNKGTVVTAQIPG